MNKLLIKKRNVLYGTISFILYFSYPFISKIGQVEHGCDAQVEHENTIHHLNKHLVIDFSCKYSSDRHMKLLQYGVATYMVFTLSSGPCTVPTTVPRSVFFTQPFRPYLRAVSDVNCSRTNHSLSNL